ncbi:MAG: hypothetical protein ACFWTJ_04780 [Lachnoclostridium sp.]|jgi:holo-[acyl-carrier protein] synthase
MFGTGFAGIRPIDIEILRDERGRPYVNLYGTALERSKVMEISNTFVSITNTKGYASAYVIGEKDDKTAYDYNFMERGCCKRKRMLF